MSKIVTSIENGYMIFKKEQENADEVLFYNSDYFRRIGFPDADVSIIKAGNMKGGYYKSPEKLTYPFRQFVYLIQREKSKEVGYSSIFSSSTPDTNTTERPDFFERLNSYGVSIYKGVQSGINLAKPYFKKKPEDMTEEEKKQESEIELEEKREEEKIEQEEEEQKKQAVDKDNYWVVKIEIKGTPSKSPVEAEEAKWRQTLKESKVDLSLGKSKVGPMFEVGNRYIGMCESIKEWSPPIPTGTVNLPGSLINKWSKLTQPINTQESESAPENNQEPVQTQEPESEQQNQTENSQSPNFEQLNNNVGQLRSEE